jgi:hypothetical protein
MGEVAQRQPLDRLHIAYDVRRGAGFPSDALAEKLSRVAVRANGARAHKTSTVA